MALPTSTDGYDNFTDQLVYFSARLAADPKVAELAEAVDALLEQVDSSHQALREARRAEVKARAVRDHRDEQGDHKVRRFKREVDVFDETRFVRERMFDRGVSYLTRPRGRAQVERLASLRQSTADVLASAQLAAHAESEALTQTLSEGAKIVEACIASLDAAVTDWEDQTVELSRARDLYEFHKSTAVAELGAVIGQLRALLGGSASAAYAYTASARRPADDEGDEGEDEAAGEAAGG